MNINVELLTEYLSGKIDGREALEVESWIGESAENEKLAEQIYFLLKSSEQVDALESVNEELAYEKFRELTAKRKSKVSFRKILNYAQRVAAVLFIPLALGLLYLLQPKHQEELPVQYVEITSKPGMVSAVDLPDGTKVWLNAGSRLKYPVVFAENNRIVDLSGQAYFDVVKDEQKPFIVNTSFSYSVEVIGTEFDLCAYEDDNVIGTTLVDGSVKINIPRGDQKDFSRVLKPGEKAEYITAGNKLAIKNVNTEHESAWRDGMLIFKETPMEKVLKTLSRYYNVEFNILNDKVRESKITGKFGNEQLPQILEYLKLASGIEYTIHKPVLTGDGSVGMSVVDVK